MVPTLLSVPHNNRAQGSSGKQLGANRFVCIPIHFPYNFHTFPVHSFDSLPPIFGTADVVKLRCRTKEGNAHEKSSRRVPGRPRMPRRAAVGGARALHVRDAGRWSTGSSCTCCASTARATGARSGARRTATGTPSDTSRARSRRSSGATRARSRRRCRSFWPWPRSSAPTRWRRSSTGGSRSSSDDSGARRTTSANANGGRSSPLRGARSANTTR